MICASNEGSPREQRALLQRDISKGIFSDKGHELFIYNMFYFANNWEKSRILSLQNRQIFYKSYVDKKIISYITDFIFSVDLVHILRKSWQIFVPYNGPLFRYNWVLQEEPSTSSLLGTGRLKLQLIFSKLSFI